MSYSLKFPIDYNRDNSFKLTTDILENSKQNMKMLLLTNPGERIMNPDYGIGIKKFLFEVVKSDYFYDSESKKALSYKNAITNKITEQVSKYIKNVNILKVDIVLEEEVAQINIKYSISDVVADEISIRI